LNISSHLGVVYLGETFRTCISINHISRYDLSHVGVKIEIQTTAHRSTLVDSTAAEDNFLWKVGDTADYIIHHKITELGVNCLVCSIYYTDDMAQKRSFQKFFKFEVQSPFVIKTSVRELPDKEMLYAELNLVNLIPRAIFLPSVVFVPDSSFEVEDLNTVSVPSSSFPTPTPSLSSSSSSSESKISAKSSSSLSSFGTVSPMLHQSSRSYMFRLTKKRIKDSNADSVSSIGHFEILWRSLIGENGRLHTKPITRVIKQNDHITFDLKVINAPYEAVLETPFTILVEVRNRSSSRLELRLQWIKEKMGAILPFGQTSRSLGVFGAEETRQVPLTLIALGLGVQQISGFRLSCPLLGTFADLEYSHNVVVVKNVQ